MTTLNVSRAIYLNVLCLLGLTDWLIKYFNPSQNVGNWIAALAGAFIARFFFPGQMTPKVFWLGWLIGTLVGLLFGPDLAMDGGFWIFKRPESIHAIVALLGDLLVQFVAFLIRLFTKVGDYTVEHPGQAFDSGLDRIEKVAGVWIRIKTSVLDILDIFNKRS